MDLSLDKKSLVKETPGTHFTTIFSKGIILDEIFLLLQS